MNDSFSKITSLEAESRPRAEPGSARREPKRA